MNFSELFSLPACPTAIAALVPQEFHLGRTDPLTISMTEPFKQRSETAYNQLMVNWWFGLVVRDSNRGTHK